MNKYHNIKEIKIEGDNLYITIDDLQRIYAIRQLSPTLAKASDTELKVFEISPSGYGIHWPLLDEDISINGLLGVKQQPSRMKKSA